MGFTSKLLQLVMMMISGGVDCDGDGVDDDGDVEDEMRWMLTMVVIQSE